MDVNESLFRQGAICDVNSKNSPPQTGHYGHVFVLKRSKRTQRSIEDSASLKEKFEIMVDFNLLL